MSEKISSLEVNESEDTKIKNAYKNQLKSVDQVQTSLAESPELQSDTLKS